MRTPMIAAVLAATILIAACGDGDDAGGADAARTTDVTTDATEATRTTGTSASAVSDPPSTAAATTPSVDSTEATTGDTAADREVPQSIVSLSPVHTEMLFAIGAGDQVIAVDDQSNFPPEAATVMTDLSGFEPNIEAIASYEPDLVIAQSDSVQAPLEELGIEVWVGLAAPTLEDSYAQIEQLGAVTGHIAEAAEVVAAMETDIEAIVESVPDLDQALTVYHELGPDLYSADSTTFIGHIYAQLGLQNIADRVEGNHFGYPQLSAEVIISADPDLIFLADTVCCDQDAETVAARDGWESITAVTEGRVFEMDDDTASRWGPRIVEYYQAVADAVIATAGVPAGG